MGAKNVWQRALRAQKDEYEKQIRDLEKHHHAEIFALEKQLNWTLLKLQDAELKLRMKDWEIARKEEQNSALQRLLRREAQLRRSFEAQAHSSGNDPGGTCGSSGSKAKHN